MPASWLLPPAWGKGATKSQDFEMDLAERLERIGWNLNRFAVALGVSRRVVSLWRAGQRRNSQTAQIEIDLMLQALEYRAGRRHCPCCERGKRAENPIH